MAGIYLLVMRQSNSHKLEMINLCKKSSKLSEIRWEQVPNLGISLREFKVVHGFAKVGIFFQNIKYST